MGKPCPVIIYLHHISFDEPVKLPGELYGPCKRVNTSQITNTVNGIALVEFSGCRILEHIGIFGVFGYGYLQIGRIPEGNVIFP